MNLDTSGVIQPPPAVTIRFEYRQLGYGPDEVVVSWDAGTEQPSVNDICMVLKTLLDAGTKSHTD